MSCFCACICCEFSSELNKGEANANQEQRQLHMRTHFACSSFIPGVNMPLGFHTSASVNWP